MPLMGPEQGSARFGIPLSRLRAFGSSQPAALLTTVGLVAAATVVVDLLVPSLPVDSAGVIYLLAVLGVSSFYGLWWGLATSVGATLSFNFFLLPPANKL